MSEQIMFYGVDLASAVDICLLLRARGFEADEPWYLDDGETHSGPNPRLSFAVYRGREVCMITWADDIAFAKPLELRSPTIRTPIVSVEYADTTPFLREVLSAIAAHSEHADTLNNLVVSGSAFARKVLDPGYDWSYPTLRRNGLVD